MTKYVFITYLVLSVSAHAYDPPANYDPKSALLAFSHVNVVVEDLDKATEFYGRTLGFEQAFNKSGAMDYKNVILKTFAHNAGFKDKENVSADIRFLVHPQVGMHIELMRYRSPKGRQKIVSYRPNDMGGIRHVGFEVANAQFAFDFLKKQLDVKMMNPAKTYGPLELGPVPIKFFYWIDPWGVHWEMEEGRPATGTIKGTQG